MGKVRAESQQRQRTQALSSLPLTLVLLGGSCSLFGPAVPEEDFAFDVAVAPKTAAYLVADLARRQIRGADPSPTSAFAPILSLGGDHYAVRYSRQGDDGFRVFLNGRMTPPEPPRPTAEIGPCPLRGCRFLPAGSYSGSPLIATDEVYIRILPRQLEGGVGGCRLEGYVVGLPARGNLLMAIRQALAAAAKIRETAALLENRQFRAADSEAAAAVTAFAAAQPFLLSRLLCHRAAAEAAHGDLLAARSFLSRALDHDERLQAARYWLFAADKRLANLNRARRSLVTLAQSELPEPLRSRAQATLMKSLREQRRSDDPKLFEQLAREALDKWDLVKAYAYARKAIAAGSTSPETQAILARVHGLRAQHQLAFEEELLLFTGGQDQPKLVARMAERQLALENAPAGLRLLALNWKQVQATDPIGAEALLERLLNKTGPELASRILVNTGAQELAKAQLQKWRATGGANKAAIGLLERVPMLRAQQQKPPPSPPPAAIPKSRTGFETAPGVLPQR